MSPKIITKEKIDFIKKNASIMTIGELSRRLDLNYYTLKSYMIDNNMPIRPKIFTTNEINFIKENSNNFTIGELATKLNRSSSTVRRYVRKYKLTHKSVLTPIVVNGINFTQKEIEVLSNISKGLTDEQVAKRMFIDITTVKSHLQNVYQKLYLAGINRRVVRIRAILWYLKHYKKLMIETDF